MASERDGPNAIWVLFCSLLLKVIEVVGEWRWRVSDWRILMDSLRVRKTGEPFRPEDVVSTLDETLPLWNRVELYW